MNNVITNVPLVPLILVNVLEKEKEIIVIAQLVNMMTELTHTFATNVTPTSVMNVLDLPQNVLSVLETEKVNQIVIVQKTP